MPVFFPRVTAQEQVGQVDQAQHVWWPSTTFGWTAEASQALPVRRAEAASCADRSAAQPVRAGCIRPCRRRAGGDPRSSRLTSSSLLSFDDRPHRPCGQTQSASLQQTMCCRKVVFRGRGGRAARNEIDAAVQVRCVSNTERQRRAQQNSAADKLSGVVCSLGAVEPKVVFMCDQLVSLHYELRSSNGLDCSSSRRAFGGTGGRSAKCTSTVQQAVGQ